MKILDSVFFSNPTNSTSIGIVLVKESEEEELMCYIGNCKEATSQKVDEKWIAEWGSTFPNNAAKAFFPSYFKTKNKKG